MLKVMIAQPTAGSVVTGAVGYLMEVGRTLSAQGIDWGYHALALAEIPLSRNIFASHVISDNIFTHLLFIDSDIGVLPRTILRMIAFDKPVVAAACPKRHLDWDHFRRIAEAEAGSDGDRRRTDVLLDLALSFNVETRYSDGSPFAPKTSGAFMTVPAIGTGIMLIHRDVFEIMLAQDVARPRPGYQGLPLLDGAPLCDFFSPREAPDGSMTESEDISFCRRWVEECGGEIWADVDSRIMHFGMRGHSGRYMPHAKRDFDRGEDGLGEDGLGGNGLGGDGSGGGEVGGGGS